MSIRYQLLLPLLTLLLGVVGMSAWAALASAQQAQTQLELQARQIVRTLQQARFPLTENVLRLMKGFSGAEYLLVDARQQRLTTLPASDIDVSAIPITAEAERGIELEHQVHVGAVSYLAAGLRLEQGPDAGATVYIFYPESLWRDALWQAVRPSVLFGILGGLAAIILTVILAQRLTRRVQALQRRTRLIAAGDFSPMPLPRRQDELRDLSRSINEMAERLAHYQKTLQTNERLRLLGQVGGGLAHQLRNGITGAKLAVQLHIQECTSLDTETLTVALRQLRLLELHLKRFLDLGRAGSLQRSRCDLLELLRETVDLLRPRCRHAGIELRWQVPADTVAIVQGDAGQLGQLFLNILTNAVEAAGPGGWVSVQIADCRLPIADLRKEQLSPDRQFAIRNPESVRVIIRDSGPGPAADVAERLFEPFVTGKPEGVGLGLAVAQQVVAAHGGNIRWQREADGTCFVIELPMEAMA